MSQFLNLVVALVVGFTLRMALGATGDIRLALLVFAILFPMILVVLGWSTDTHVKAWTVVALCALGFLASELW